MLGFRWPVPDGFATDEFGLDTWRQLAAKAGTTHLLALERFVDRMCNPRQIRASQQRLQWKRFVFGQFVEENR